MDIASDGTALIAASVSLLAIAVFVLAIVVWRSFRAVSESYAALLVDRRLTGVRARSDERAPDNLMQLLEDQAHSMNLLSSKDFEGALKKLVDAESRLLSVTMQWAATSLNLNDYPSYQGTPDHMGPFRAEMVKEIGKKLLGTFNRWVGLPGGK